MEVASRFDVGKMSMGTLYKRGGDTYYGEFTAPDGRRVRKSTGTSIKSLAAKVLAQWEADAIAMRHGIPVDGWDLHELITEFAKTLGDDIYRTNTEQRINRIVDLCNWTKPAQINQAQLESTVRDLKKVRNGKKELSAQSKAHYITAMKMFTRWLHRVKKVLPYDAIASTKKPNPKRDRKLVRRFLLPAEWTWLAKTPNSLLYETAIQTGLRSSELRSLRRQHVKHDHVLLPGRFTKNGDDAQQYITSDLRARLVDALPFAMPEREDVASMLYDDLAIARSMWVDAGGKSPADFLQAKNSEGHVLDFHALRHTCGAWLAIAGVNAKVIQKVMRHSTIVLTLDTYGHLMPGETQGVVEKLGAVLNGTLTLDTNPLPKTQKPNDS